jgi:hypothetical protein
VVEISVISMTEYKMILSCLGLIHLVGRMVGRRERGGDATGDGEESEGDVESDGDVESEGEAESEGEVESEGDRDRGLG